MWIEDQCNLRRSCPHWAQRLEAAGYETGYFGKWHVERTDDLTQFGWQVNGGTTSELYRRKQEEVGGGHKSSGTFSVEKTNDLPEGYSKSLLYGVTDTPVEKRGVGITTELGLDFLKEHAESEDPWCCFVSITEPHDPFVTGQEAYDRYDADSIPLQPNVHNELIGQPNVSKGRDHVAGYG